MVFRHIDGSIYIFHFFFMAGFVGRLSGSPGGLDWSHTCRAPPGGGRVYGGTGLVLFAIHVSEIWFFGGPTVLGTNPPAASFVLRLARVRLPSASAHFFASSSFFFLVMSKRLKLRKPLVRSTSLAPEAPRPARGNSADGAALPAPHNAASSARVEDFLDLVEGLFRDLPASTTAAERQVCESYVKAPGSLKSARLLVDAFCAPLVDLLGVESPAPDDEASTLDLQLFATDFVRRFLRFKATPQVFAADPRKRAVATLRQSLAFADMLSTSIVADCFAIKGHKHGYTPPGLLAPMVPKGTFSADATVRAFLRSGGLFLPDDKKHQLMLRLERTFVRVVVAAGLVSSDDGLAGTVEEFANHIGVDKSKFGTRGAASTA